MPLSLDDFGRMLDKPSRTKDDLITILHNCKKDAQRAAEALDRLNSHWPGWDKPKANKGGSRETIARFKTVETTHPSARAAYVWLIERFSQTFPQLFEDVRWETTGLVAVGRSRGPEGAARNYFARSPGGLFLRSPELAKNNNHFAQLLNGWYVSLNLNTVENFDILCRFGYVAGLRHENEWDWIVLDPSQGLSERNARNELARKLLQELRARGAQRPATDA